mmetsp:Transcript_21451/g.57299  ORF Transcript_21451/g.57299 Transcript_21451/m.57299 type:complete len:322 (+) Transcript_21451:89-1054(+)
MAVAAALCALALLAGRGAAAADVASRVGAQSLIVGADAAVSPSAAPATRQMRREHLEEPRPREAEAARWDQVKQDLQQRLQQQLTQLQSRTVEQKQEQSPQSLSQAQPETWKQMKESQPVERQPDSQPPEPQSLLQDAQPQARQAQQEQQPLQQQHQQQEAQKQDLPQAQLELQQAQPGYGQPVHYGQQVQNGYSRPPQYSQPVQYGQPVQYSQPPPQYSQPVQSSQPAPYGHPHYAPHNIMEAQQEVNAFEAVAARAVVQSGVHPAEPVQSTTQPCFGGGPCEDTATVEEDTTVYLCIIGIALLASIGYCQYMKRQEAKK